MNSQGNKKLLVGIGIVVVVLILSGVFVLSRVKSSKQEEPLEELENEEVIPTVDSSVVVSLEPTRGNREVVLTVKNIPSGTRRIEYELSYDARGQGPQGAIGSVELKKGQRSLEKTITLGTCSSGTCVYHDVVGEIRLSLKFMGTYGERIFEKEYRL
ncbi:hypothetical protein HYT33_03850 [Candidatus Roizmanbacteria bacterium]|nr:hypothetical protein [Candidatus Roizmanbacteria bacterium]